MAKVEGLDIDPSIRDLFFNALKVDSLYYGTNITSKGLAGSRSLKSRLNDETLLNNISVSWAGLSDVVKSSWDSAGAECGLTGFSLFLQDTIYRILNSLSGFATPNLFHQYKVLRLYSPSFYDVPNGDQYHEQNYKLKIFRSGSKDAYDWVDVNEVFSSPLKLEFNYYSNMLSKPDYHFWKVSCGFYGTKDGSNDSYAVGFPLDLVTGWKLFSETIIPDLDTIDYYYIKLYGYRILGTAYFDNFNIEHSGQNWAFDPFCNSVESAIIYDAISPDPAWRSRVSRDENPPHSVYIS